MSDGSLCEVNPKAPEVAGANISNEIMSVIVDGGDTRLSCQYECPLSLLVPMQLAYTPPDVRRKLTPASAVAIGSSRCVTSRDQPPSRIFTCASANENFRFGIDP